MKEYMFTHFFHVQIIPLTRCSENITLYGEKFDKRDESFNQGA